jgi:hypothetical protein
MLRLVLSIVALLVLIACGKSEDTVRNCWSAKLGNDLQISCSDGTTTYLYNGASSGNNVTCEVL